MPATLATAARSEGRPSRIKEFNDLPQYGSSYYHPAAIATLGGDLWVIDEIDQDFGENAVVRIATSGKQLHAFYYSGLSTEGASFLDLAVGPDGALWITDQYNSQIVRMTTAGSFSNYPLAGVTPFSIVSGPDKALWFTGQDQGGGVIGRISTNGKVTTYPVSAQVWDIATGPDDALWFTEAYANAIGRITRRGKIVLYTKGISYGARPFSITLGPDKALWFTELADKIGRIKTSGSVTEYSPGTSDSESPYDIAAGPDGNLWFTESQPEYEGARICRITTSGKITAFSKNLDPIANPTGITAGPDGNMWFVESFTDRTGRLRL